VSSTAGLEVKGEEKKLDRTGTRTPTPRPPSPHPVAIRTELSRFRKNGIWTGNDLEGSGHGLIEVLLQNCSGETEINHEDCQCG
jgi:hypothetical protein